MSNFTKEDLLLSPLPDARVWVVERQIEYRYGDEFSPLAVIIPVGFQTDGLSTLGFKVAQMFLPQWGLYSKAVILHDYLYRFAEMVDVQKEIKIPISRKMADDIFLEALTICKVGHIRRKLIYAGVRVFGGFIYKPTYKLSIN